MKTALAALTIALLFLQNTSIAEDASTPSSGTRAASAVVKISAPSGSLGANRNVLNAMIRSSAVAGKAYSEIGGPAEENASDFIRVKFISSETIRPVLGPDEQNRRKAAMLNVELQNISGLIEHLEAQIAALKKENMQERVTAASSQLEELKNRRDKTKLQLSQLSSGTAANAADTEWWQHTIELEVAFPQSGPAIAEEFLAAIINNLRSVLEDAAKKERQELSGELAVAIAERKAAQERLDEITKKAKVAAEEPQTEEDSADIAVYKQLDRTVDLSALSPDMAFGDALEVVKNSVQPPLKILVNWRDLQDTADVNPTTLINMGPISSIKLSTAFDRVLEIASGGFVDIGYVIDGGVITIATKGSLPHKLVPRVYRVPRDVTMYNFIDAIQCVEPDSWSDNGGEGTITPYGDSRLIVNQFPEVHRKLYNFLQTLEAQPAAPQVAVPQASVEVLLDRKQELMRDKQKLETDNARLGARRKAIEQQLGDIRSKVESKISDDVVMKELQGILDRAVEQQQGIERLLNSGRAETAEVTKIAEQVARTKIEMAQRREQLAKESGGDLLTKFNSELANITVELAENQAVLEITNRQIAEVDSQLAAAAADEPYKSELHLAKEALQAATIRVNEIQSRLESLRPPTVTIIGAD